MHNAKLKALLDECRAMATVRRRFDLPCRRGGVFRQCEECAALDRNGEGNCYSDNHTAENPNDDEWREVTANALRNSLALRALSAYLLELSFDPEYLASNAGWLQDGHDGRPGGDGGFKVLEGLLDDLRFQVDGDVVSIHRTGEERGLLATYAAEDGAMRRVTFLPLPIDWPAKD